MISCPGTLRILNMICSLFLDTIKFKTSVSCLIVPLLQPIVSPLKLISWYGFAFCTYRILNQFTQLSKVQFPQQLLSTNAVTQSPFTCISISSRWLLVARVVQKDLDSQIASRSTTGDPVRFPSQASCFCTSLVFPSLVRQSRALRSQQLGVDSLLGILSILRSAPNSM